MNLWAGSLGLFLLWGLAQVVRSLSRALDKRGWSLPDVAMLLAIGIFTAVGLKALPISLHAITAPFSAPWLMTMAASLILYYGGAELTPEVLKATWKPILLLAVVGVFVSTGVLAVLTSGLGLGGLTLSSALLLGAVLAGTDPSVLVAVLDQVPINERAREMLIAESALNDPVSALVASTLLAAAMPGVGTLSGAVLTALWQVASAVVLSAVAWGIWRSARHIFDSWPVIRFLLPFAVVLSLATLIHSSSFLCCFLTGVSLRPLQASQTPKHPVRHASRSHHRTQKILFYTRAYIFLMLGLTININSLGQYALPAALTSLLLVGIARPVSVAVVKAISGASLTRREALFLSLNRQTGVIPALFAGVLIQMHSPGAAFIHDAVIASVLLTAVVLLPFFGTIARLCQMTVHGEEAKTH